MNKIKKRVGILLMGLATICAFAGCELPKDSDSSIAGQECVHEWNDGEVVKEATCKEEGAISYICGLCGEEKEEAVALLAHNYINGVCGVCGAVEGTDVHVCKYDIEEILSKATCTEGEKVKYSCVCGSFYTTIIGEAVSHVYEIVSRTEATCGVAGVINYECSLCGEQYAKALEALEHDYAEKIAKVATCEEAGEKSYTCMNCEDTYTEEIAALGGEHEMQGTIIEDPTCTAEGRMSNTCKKCGVVKLFVILPLGHTWGDGVIVQEATCAEEGRTEFECLNCDARKVSKTEKLEHDYTEEVTKNATCAEPGVKTFTCTNCGTIHTEEIAATGHIIDENSDGICDECGKETVELRLMSDTDYLKVGGTYRIYGGFKNSTGFISELIFYDESGVAFKEDFFNSQVYAFAGKVGITISFEDSIFVKLKTEFKLADDYSYVEFTILESEEFTQGDFSYTYEGKNYELNCHLGIKMDERRPIYEVNMA